MFNEIQPQEGAILSERQTDVDDQRLEHLKRRENLRQLISPWYAGDLHVHSNNSYYEGIVDTGDRELTHERGRVIQYAELLGLSFVSFSEHASNPGNPVCLPNNHPICERLRRNAREIALLNAEQTNIEKEEENVPTIYSAVEASILYDGNEENRTPLIDVPDEVLSEVDIRIASIHAILNANKRDPIIAKRLLMSAIENPYIDIIGHPYRHIEFYPHDWKVFKKIMETRDPLIFKQLEEIDIGKDYQTLKKIIGKAEILGDEQNLQQIKDLKELFDQTEVEYWQMWEDVLDKMEVEGTVFEINLNVLNPNDAFYSRLIGLASSHPRLQFSIVSDFHNLRQFKDGIKRDKLLTDLPAEEYGHMPKARSNAIRRLVDVISLLEGNGITADRVINSSVGNMRRYLKQRDLRIGRHEILENPDLNKILDISSMSESIGVELTSSELITYSRNNQGEPEKIIVEYLGADSKCYRLVFNTQFEFEKMFEVMKSINDQMPTNSARPLSIIKAGSQTALIYETVEGVGLNSFAEIDQVDADALFELLPRVSEFLHQIHNIGFSDFESSLNDGNSSLEKVIARINPDTIDRIRAYDPQVAGELGALLAELIIIERGLLSDNSRSALIHGDFHPGNIIIKPDGEICIIDCKSFTKGFPERDIASLLEQVGAQFERFSDEEILSMQETIINSYPGEIDKALLIFYRSWITWRNALYNYSVHYLGRRYNSGEQGMLNLRRSRDLLNEYKSKL